ncbi:MAG: AraC family transcriptional regulator, partial [Pedobacter sp.]
PTEVYLEVGFEDLSHFSFSFKKKYGISPNQL